jgi:hypothetical protein
MLCRQIFRLPHVATSSSELDVKVALFNGLLMNANKALPTPVTMWTLREDFPAAAHERDSVWAVFRFHEEVRPFKLVNRFRSDLEADHFPVMETAPETRVLMTNLVSFVAVHKT